MYSSENRLIPNSICHFLYTVFLRYTSHFLTCCSCDFHICATSLFLKMFHVFVLSLVLIFNFIHVCCGACYARDGTVLSGGYLPCDSTTSESACCLLDEGDGGPADICTTAGLCYRQDGIPGILYQDACTDKTWASSSCPKFCNSESPLSCHSDITT